MLEEISSGRPSLSPSERQVADYVLAAADAVLRKNLATIAQEAGVSEPTVVRFCRSVGSTGLPDFKLKLAQRLSRGAPYIHSAVQPGDDLHGVVRKTCNASLAAICDVQESLDFEAIRRATAAILTARRVDCYGIGVSAIAAMDAYQKFIHIGVPTQYSSDTHLQTVLAATLKHGDVALVFSHTGQSRDTVRAARVARQHGAVVVGITGSDTILARDCAITIAVDPIEDTFVYVPMVARVAHLVVVDILATNVALARGPQISEQFKQLKETLRDQWIDMDVALETTSASSRRELQSAGGSLPPNGDAAVGAVQKGRRKREE